MKFTAIAKAGAFGSVFIVLRITSIQGHRMRVLTWSLSTLTKLPRITRIESEDTNNKLTSQKHASSHNRPIISVESLMEKLKIPMLKSKAKGILILPYLKIYTLLGLQHVVYHLKWWLVMSFVRKFNISFSLWTMLISKDSLTRYLNPQVDQYLPGSGDAIRG